MLDYVVVESDRDDNGLSIAADAVDLNGGTIRDNAGNDANLDSWLFRIQRRPELQGERPADAGAGPSRGGVITSWSRCSPAGGAAWLGTGVSTVGQTGRWAASLKVQSEGGRLSPEVGAVVRGAVRWFRRSAEQGDARGQTTTSAGCTRTAGGCGATTTKLFAGTAAPRTGRRHSPVQPRPPVRAGSGRGAGPR